MTAHDHNTAANRRWRGEGGYTMNELLVSLLLFLAVMAIVVPIVITTIRAEPRISQRSNDIQRARTAVERMVRDLRAGFAIDVAGPSQLVVRTYTRMVTCGGTQVLPSNQPATPCRVSYTCSGDSCVRAEQPTTGGGGSAATIVRGLSSSQVFAYTPSGAAPGYVQIKLVFPTDDGDDTITLEDGVDLRNVTPRS